MQPIPEELYRVLSHRLKLGSYAKPVCRVEVDRLAFIPGRTEELRWVTLDTKDPTTVTNDYTNNEQATDPIYSAAPSIGMVYPIQGYTHNTVTYTDDFGTRNGGHMGVDMGIPTGTPLLASWSGKVVYITRQLHGGPGFSINIKHDGGLMTRYLHMDEIAVQVGDTVTQGQYLGKSGNTGDSTGPHLHFEIWEGVNQDAVDPRGSGRAVDAKVYFTGAKRLYTDSYNPGGLTEGTETGYRGELKVSENFDRRDWYNNSRYVPDGNFEQHHQLEKGWTLYDSGGKAVFSFIEDGQWTGFNINLGSPYPCVLDIGFSGNFNKEQGDYLIIRADDREVRRFVDFKNMNTLQELKGIAIPAGTQSVRIGFVYGGNPIIDYMGRQTLPKQIAIDYMRIQELLPTRPASKTSVTPSAPLIDLSESMFNERTETATLEVGSFVYMDTLELPGVMSVEVDDQFEADIGEARIVVSNPRGMLSPDYMPTYFLPEMVDLSSPWSYWINGFHVGVLSDNTPIRIFLGYGQTLMRVFTGLIDKADMNDDETMTISCRDMYKKIIEKVITEEKKYPDKIHTPDSEKVWWELSAVVQDLAAHAKMLGWRGNEQDRYYPDAVIEESVLIEVNQAQGYVVKAVPDQEGEFRMQPIAAYPTPQGWRNPFCVPQGTSFPAFGKKVGEAISELTKDTNYRAKCDRYGTFRFETLNYTKPVSAEFNEHQNIIQITKEVDWSRGRSHLAVSDGTNIKHYVDKEILLELKGEVRTGVITVPWAKTDEMKRIVAERAFFDIKRVCRTLQVSIPGNPALDVMDRIMVRDHKTTTNAVYIIKGIRSNFSAETGYVQVVDLTWADGGVMA